jgi:hypothetical protein
MSASKKQKYFQIALAISISLLLWRPLPASSFSQNGGGNATAAGDQAGGITMQAVSGTVVETMDSGGYTYALVEKDGAKTWVALPKSKIAVGNEITCQPGMVMNNFRSSSLNRTFEHIVFSRGITSYSAGDAPPAATPVPDETADAPKAKPKNDWGKSF